MGNEALPFCCDNKNKQAEFHQVSQLQAQSIDEEHYTAYKQKIDKINLLADIDHTIKTIKLKKQYLQTILAQFQSVQKFIDFIDNQKESSTLTVVQGKTYDTLNHHYDSVDNRNITFEHAIVNLKEFRGQISLFNSASIFENADQILKKVRLLQLQESRSSVKEQIYIKSMLNSLMDIQQIKDKCWDLTAKPTNQEMKHHVYYHFKSLIQSINGELSLGDAVSYLKIREFYHFMLEQLCKTNLQILQNQYQCSFKILDSELPLYQKGMGIVTTNFLPFCPVSQNAPVNGQQTARLSILPGDNDETKPIIKMLLKPLHRSSSAYKFRHYDKLYFAPLTILLIQKIQYQHNQVVIQLKEMSDQYLIKQVLQLRKISIDQSINHVSINEENLLNELTALRSTINQELNEKYKVNDYQYNIPEEQNNRETLEKRTNKFLRNYYNDYVQSQQQAYQKNSRASLQLESKKNIEVDEEDIKVRFEQAPTEQQMESKSEIELIEVNSNQKHQYQKQIQKYIKKHQFQKLQNQIDSIDHFIYLTRLNLSQCWLQKIQHMHCFPNLTELFLYSNQITKLQGLEANANLRLLSLSRNQIEKVENIDGLVHLRKLYLTKNHLGVDSAEYLCHLQLPKLELLSISFKVNPDESFEILLRKIPLKLKKLVINQADFLSHRTKNSITRKLKKGEVQYFHW